MKNDLYAYPLHEDATEANNMEQRGMTLRDYFASRAITTLVNFTNDKTYELEAAETAYRYADALMKAREK